jgi:hypothetical protein
MIEMDVDDTATIPFCETYRGVGVHVFQTPERICKVKSEIDKVYAIGDLGELFAYACASRNPPEARLFAAAKLEATWEQAVENREARPPVNLERLRAVVAMLDSLGWISLWQFGSLLDHSGEPREQILTDDEIEKVAGRRRR